MNALFKIYLRITGVPLGVPHASLSRRKLGEDLRLGRVPAVMLEELEGWRAAECTHRGGYVLLVIIG